MKSLLSCRRGMLPLAALAVLSACHDQPLDPVATGPKPVRAALACTVQVRPGTLSCEQAGPSTTGVSANVVVGLQNVNVRLTSTGTAYDSAAQVLSSEVTVHNLLSQPMGTADGGATVYGVNVFLASGPTVSAGQGEVTVEADGVGTFTAASQPYFHYPQVLQPHGISDPKTWRFHLPPGVETFTFTAYVETKVALETAPLLWRLDVGNRGGGAAIRALAGVSRFNFAVGDGGAIYNLATSADSWVAVPSGSHADLHGVWVGTPHRAVAVGDEGTLLRWDGNRWSTLRGGISGASLESVWGAGDHVYAVGWDPDSTGPGRHSVILQSQDGGATWASDTAAALPGRYLKGVWASGTGEVYAVGYAFDGAAGHIVGHILHSSDAGVTWSSTVSAAGTARYLYAVWGSGPGDVYAAGEETQPDGSSRGVLLHSADGGASWSVQIDVARNSAYTAISGTGAGNVFVVGYLEAAKYPGWHDGLVQRSTDGGATWARAALPGYGAANRDLYAALAQAGSDQLHTAGIDGAYIYRAGSWFPLLGFSVNEPVRAVWVMPDGSAVAAGARLNDWGSYMPVRFSKRASDPAWYFGVTGGLTSGSYNAVWGDGTSVFFAGEINGDGIVARSDDGGQSIAAASSLPGRRLNGIRGVGSRLFAVADQGSPRGTREGVVLVSDNRGASWSAEPVPNYTGDLFLKGVWAAADSLAFAVGYQANGGTGRDEGVIVRREQGSAHVITSVSASGRRLFAVWGSSVSDLWAVGSQANLATGLADGLVLHSTDRGFTWTPQVLAGEGRPRGLYAVWGTGPADVWVAGNAGALLHFDGTRWQEMNTGVGGTLYGVGGNGTRKMYAVGENQVILRGTP